VDSQSQTSAFSISFKTDRKSDDYESLHHAAGSLFFYLGSITALGFMYRSYAPHASCAANITFMTLTIVGMRFHSCAPKPPAVSGLPQ